MLAFQKRLTVIRPLHVQSAQERFMIGFQDGKLASHVRRNLHLTKPPTLKRQYQINVATEVKAAMLEMNLPIFDVSDKIMIDVAASLCLPKADVDTYDEFEQETLDTADFLMLPFVGDVGIVIPIGLEYEDCNKFVLSSYVIERA
jgi:hypothetical protein